MNLTALLLSLLIPLSQLHRSKKDEMRRFPFVENLRNNFPGGGNRSIHRLSIRAAIHFFSHLTVKRPTKVIRSFAGALQVMLRGCDDWGGCSVLYGLYYIVQYLVKTMSQGAVAKNFNAWKVTESWC